MAVRTGRGPLFTIHKWTALTLAALLFLQGLTGVILANKDALLPLFNPEARITPVGTPASIDAQIAAAVATAPGAAFDRLIYSPEPDLATVARLRQPDRSMVVVLIDSGSATALSSGSVWRYPTQLAERLHVSLMMGSTGHLVLLLEGLALTFLGVSGLILWWPRPGRWRAAFSIRWRARPRRVLFHDLHLSPGAIAAPFLLLSGLTGTLIIAEPLIKPLVALVAPVLPEVMPALPPVAADARPVMNADQILQTLRQRFPDGQLRSVRQLADGRLTGAIFIASDAANPRAHHMAGIDVMTGQLFILADGANLPSGEAALSWILPLHTGEVFGWARRPVTTLYGLTLILLVVTGILSWVSAPRRRKARK